MTALTVLHLAANRWWTGSADPIIQLVNGLRAREHRVLLGLIPGGRFDEKAREAGLEPLPGLSLEARVHPIRLVKDLLLLRTLVAREGVDVVHVHHAHDHWLGRLCAGRAALVRTFHNARSVDARWPSTALYRRTDALIAVSGEIEERCRRLRVPAAALVRVAGVVDLARFDEPGDGERIRKEFGLGAAPVVGSIARLAPNRGHELLIRGFELLLAERPDARLLLVGKGEWRAELEALVRARGLREQVLFTGYRDADLPAVLAALDVFALMGAGSDESCRAVLEAMATGKPIVARRVGALPETVQHEHTGLLLDHDRPETVAAGLRTLLADPARARGMGEAGRRLAHEAFSPARHAARVEEVYRETVARRARR